MLDGIKNLPSSELQHSITLTAFGVAFAGAYILWSGVKKQKKEGMTLDSIAGIILGSITLLFSLVVISGLSI